MKLVSHLPKQTFWLYLGPVLNVLLILLVFFLLGSSFVIKSGITVKLPESGSRLSGFDSARVVTVSASTADYYYLDGKPVTIQQLETGLKELTREGRRVIVHADTMAPFGRVQEVGNLALKLGYEIAYATQPDLK